MKIFNRQITVEKIDEEVTNDVELKEDENMEKAGFFARHKKGIVIAALGTLAAGAAALVVKSRSDDDFDDYDDESYDVNSDQTSDDSPSED